MAHPFRVIDTGIRDGRENIAFDQALIDAHQEKIIPDTIHFLQFPPTALIGRHQALSRELHLDYCRANGIGIARRITGGGAIYLDEGQLGWGLVFHRSTLGITSLTDLSKVICEAVATGLGKLGINARYRPRNDIEVDGRKISGTGGLYDGDTVLFQGTVLVDMNPNQMIAALNVPAAKLAKKDLASSGQRVVTLSELLGENVPSLETVKSALLDGFAEKLDIEPIAGEVTPTEEALTLQLLAEEIGTDEFVAEIDDPDAAPMRCGEHHSAGGTVTTYLKLDGPQQDRIHTALITGDFFVTPPRVILDLEASLKGTRTSDVQNTIDKFFQHTTVDTLSISKTDFHQSIKLALGSDLGN